MENARFSEIGEVLEEELFLPFRLGLEEMMRQLHEMHVDGIFCFE